MAIQKRHIVTGGIALLTISGAYLYWQYTKLVASAIKFARIGIKKVSPTEVNFDLFLTFTNRSKVKFIISEQQYKVFLNDVFITQASRPEGTLISPLTTSPMTVNVSFNPAKIGQDVKKDLPNLLMNFNKNTIRVEVNLTIQLWLFKLSIPYTYMTTVAELMAPKASN